MDYTKSVIGRQIRSIAVLFRLDTTIYESTEGFCESYGIRACNQRERANTLIGIRGSSRSGYSLNVGNQLTTVFSEM